MEPRVVTMLSPVVFMFAVGILVTAVELGVVVGVGVAPAVVLVVGSVVGMVVGAGVVGSGSGAHF